MQPTSDIALDPARAKLIRSLLGYRNEVENTCAIGGVTFQASLHQFSSSSAPYLFILRAPVGPEGEVLAPTFEQVVIRFRIERAGGLIDSQAALLVRSSNEPYTVMGHEVLDVSPSFCDLALEHLKGASNNTIAAASPHDLADLTVPARGFARMEALLPFPLFMAHQSNPERRYSANSILVSCSAENRNDSLCAIFGLEPIRSVVSVAIAPSKCVESVDCSSIPKLAALAGQGGWIRVVEPVLGSFIELYSARFSPENPAIGRDSYNALFHLAILDAERRV